MITPCPQCSLPPTQFFLRGARWGFGIWLFYVGLVKWMGGPGNFVGYITGEFANTWSPGTLNLALAWLIIIAEPLLGLWLVLGIRQRTAWAAAALLMFLLMFGMTMLQKPAGDNFIFFVFCLVAAACSSDSVRAEGHTLEESQR